MRIVRVLGYGFMVLVLAGGWAFTYLQSSAVDLAALDSTRVALAELRAIDEAWTLRLVNGTPPGLSPGAAAPVAGQTAARPARYRTALGAFESKVLALGVPQAGSEISRLKRDFEARATLVERLDQTIAFREEALRAQPPDPSVIAQFDVSVRSLSDQASLASNGPRLAMLGRTIDRAFESALTETELHRMALLFYSGFLLAITSFLVWSLEERRREINRINRQLQCANESLEARVAERTVALSDALARLKESEALLIQSEKMSSLGQMVAGIAHEVNTPLAYVKSSLQAVAKTLPLTARLATETERLLALLSAEDSDEAALADQFSLVRETVAAHLPAPAGRTSSGDLEQLVKDGLFGIGQISEVIANLKDFSRLDRSKVAEYDLHSGIESAIRIGHAQLQNRQVRKDYGAIPLVSCSPSQINQVILNLLSNAAQATAEGDGTITIRTGLRGAEHVALEVIDNGSGIPADVLPKIFDPFFTTKAVGKGTGLGLSICYRIIENHGGKLEVQSTPGAGASFVVLLPVIPPAAPDA